jgi:hypothetical protein
MSCGDNIIEGGKSGPAGSDLKGTINVHVRNGAGDKAFTSASDSVYVTLIDAGTRPQLLGANGSVNFTNLTEGSYEIRVEKTGYATAYYTAKILQDEVTGNTGKVVNIPAVLYKLDGTLTGTLRYQKADGSSGFADGSIVRLEVGVNRTTDVLNAEDIKIEQRVHEATVTNGKYTLTGVPAVPGIYYKLTALGFTAGGVEFADKVLFDKDGPDIGSGATSTASTKVATDVVDQLTVISISPFVTGSSPIEITFNVQPENLGVSTTLITASGVPVAVSYDASKILLTPAYAWKEKKLGVIEVTLTGLRSKNGALLATDTTGIWKGSVAVQDEDRGEFTLTNINVTTRELYISDSGEVIEFLFNDDIDTARASSNIYKNISTEAYKVAIDGKKLTVTPTTGKWVFNGNGEFTLKLTGIKSVSDNTFPASGDFTLTVKLPNTAEKFVVASATPTLRRAGTGTNERDTVYIGPNDDSLLVKLKFSLPLSKVAEDVANRKVSCDKSAIVVTYTDDEITLDVRKGELWQSEKNVVTLKNFKSADGSPLGDGSDYEILVWKKLSGTFAYIGKQTFELDSGSAPIILYFDDKIASSVDFGEALVLDPDQPYSVALSPDAESIVLSPLDGMDWKLNTAPTPTVITLDPAKIKSTGGGVLATLYPTTANENKVGVKKAGTGGGGNPLAGVSVANFALDDSVSSASEFPLGGVAAFEIRWDANAAVNFDPTDFAGSDGGYEVFIYRSGSLLVNDPSAAVSSYVFDKDNYGLTGATGKTWSALLPYSKKGTTDSLKTSYRASLPLPAALTPNRLGSDSYDLVIRPIKGDASGRLYGEPSLISGVTSRPKFDAIASATVSAPLGGPTVTPAVAMSKNTSDGRIDGAATSIATWVSTANPSNSITGQLMIMFSFTTDAYAKQVSWGDPVAISLSNVTGPHGVGGTAAVTSSELNASTGVRTYTGTITLTKAATSGDMTGLGILGTSARVVFSLSGTTSDGQRIFVDYSNGTTKTISNSINFALILN